MDAPHAHISEADGIITVTLDRDAKRNAISREITSRLWEAVDALIARDDLRCMVITAKGKFFSAGIDLSQTPGGAEAAPSKTHAGWHYRHNYSLHHRLYDVFEATEKPIVLAAQGPCYGAGFEMAMSCDFRFCTPHTNWRLPEIDIGVIAGSGGSSRLTRLVGPGWAKYIAMAGMSVSAQQAHTIGLVHDVFPAETFMESVYAFCKHVMSFPAEAVGLAKMAVDLAADVADRRAQRDIDRLVNTTLVASAEHRERVSNFLNKKK